MARLNCSCCLSLMESDSIKSRSGLNWHREKTEREALSAMLMKFQVHGVQMCASIISYRHNCIFDE